MNKINSTEYELNFFKLLTQISKKIEEDSKNFDYIGKDDNKELYLYTVFNDGFEDEYHSIYRLKNSLTKIVFFNYEENRFFIFNSPSLNVYEEIEIPFDLERVADKSWFIDEIQYDIKSILHDIELLKPY